MSTTEFTEHDVDGVRPARYDVLRCVEARARRRPTPYSTSLEIATAVGASLDDVERLVAEALASGGRRPASGLRVRASAAHRSPPRPTELQTDFDEARRTIAR
jgi:hypothetical protein